MVIKSKKKKKSQPYYIRVEIMGNVLSGPKLMGLGQSKLYLDPKTINFLRTIKRIHLHNINKTSSNIACQFLATACDG